MKLSANSDRSHLSSTPGRCTCYWTGGEWSCDSGLRLGGLNIDFDGVPTFDSCRVRKGPSIAVSISESFSVPANPASSDLLFVPSLDKSMRTTSEIVWCKLGERGPIAAGGSS